MYHFQMLPKSKNVTFASCTISRAFVQQHFSHLYLHKKCQLYERYSAEADLNFNKSHFFPKVNNKASVQQH